MSVRSAIPISTGSPGTIVGRVGLNLQLLAPPPFLQPMRPEAQSLSAWDRAGFSAALSRIAYYQGAKLWLSFLLDVHIDSERDMSLFFSYSQGRINLSGNAPSSTKTVNRIETRNTQRLT
jgi:hypothetical protein